MADKQNNFQEKRRDERTPQARLPQALQTLIVRFGEEGEEYSAKTIDASPSGISFLVDIPANSIQDFNIVIQAGDKSFTIQDELVYAKALDARTTRVSVHFSSQSDLTEYQRLLGK